MALATAKRFLRSLAQPANPKDQEGVSVWNIEQLEEYQKKFEKKEERISEVNPDEDFMDMDDEDLDLL